MADMDEIARLLREQNELLRELVQGAKMSRNPPASPNAGGLRDDWFVRRAWPGLNPAICHQFDDEVPSKSVPEEKPS